MSAQQAYNEISVLFEFKNYSLNMLGAKFVYMISNKQHLGEQQPKHPPKDIH